MATINANKMEAADRILEQLVNDEKNPIVKIVRKERGLIERKDSEEKIILEEDNRQLILG